ncbi:hypothetical protein [Varibaculum timonense]|uniref:hypothetical protein n=1 Tax=Varibaculum timonense TaxID=1964383 RepID=UPI0022DF9EEC|nr:hypothetical protein [Varibaculum timonense]
MKDTSMGMSAEDFGAVLAELTAPTPLADAFETRFPQSKGSRWWFSVRTHAASVFLSKEYYEYRTKPNVEVEGDPGNTREREHTDFSAETVWDSDSFNWRPELRLWILEALGLLKDDKDVLQRILAIEANTSRCTYLK